MKFFLISFVFCALPHVQICGQIALVRVLSLLAQTYIGLHFIILK